jgi:hypothetical protein
VSDGHAVIDPFELPKQPRLSSLLPFVAWTSVLLFMAIAMVTLSVGGASLTDAVTSVAAVAALVGAALSIRETRRISRQQLTYSYFARAFDAHHQQYNALTSAYLSLRSPPQRLNDERWMRLTKAECDRIVKDWRSMPLAERQAIKRRIWDELTGVEQLAVLPYVNFIEEIATVFNAGLLDKGLVKQTFAPWTGYYYDTGRWFIEWRREGDPAELEEWTRMEDELAAMPAYPHTRGVRRWASRWRQRVAAFERQW